MGLKRSAEKSREKLRKKRNPNPVIVIVCEGNPYTDIGDLIEYMESLEHK